MPKFHVGSGLRTDVIFITNGSQGRGEALTAAEAWAYIETRRKHAAAANRLLVEGAGPVPNCAHLILPCAGCPTDCARRIFSDEEIIASIPPMPRDFAPAL